MQVQVISGRGEMRSAYSTEVPDVGIDITNRCNLSCRHCYNDSGRAPVMELGLDQLIGLLDQLQAFGQKSVQISGGEPTLHPDFAALVHAAQRRQIKVSINTNGVYSEHVRAQLRELTLWRVAVSLEGLRENTDRIRGQGVFDQVLDSVRFFQEICADIVLAVHVRRANAAEAEPLIHLAHDLGVGIKFSPLRPVGRARQGLLDQVPTPQDYLSVVRTVIRMRRVYPELLIMTDFDVLAQGASAVRPVPIAKASCPAGRSRLNVSFDGYLYPCSFLVSPRREFALGRLGEASIPDLWRRSPVLEPFRSIRKSEQCQNCAAYGSSCSGGCVAMAYWTVGRLDAHDPVCFAEHLGQAEMDGSIHARGADDGT